jgi:hypothetical protein
MFMKLIIFAAALSLGGAALAQTGNTVSDPSQSTGPRGVTQQGTDPDGQACSPPGYNQGTGGYQPCSGDMGGSAGATGGTGSMGAMGAMPPCSRTVTDRCTQTYEGGRARSRRR